jgi:purine operon repressor
MSLSRRALREKSRVLIVDDFMKAGGTVRGMVDLLGEFNAEVAGVGVLVESGAVEKEERLLHDYVSLVKLTEVDSKVRRISAYPGNYFPS